MEPKEVFDELKTILVTRLKFDPRRAVDLTLETTLPKGIEKGKNANAFLGGVRLWETEPRSHKLKWRVM